MPVRSDPRSLRASSMRGSSHAIETWVQASVRLSVRCLKSATAFPLGSPLPSTASSTGLPDSFGRFSGTMGLSDFLGPYIVGLSVLLPDASLCERTGKPQDLPVPVQSVSTHALVLRPRGVPATQAIAGSEMLPSVWVDDVGTPG